MNITPIPAFDDNYIWLIQHDDKTLIVDPGDETPVLNWLEHHERSLDGILLTHHHPDHTGGAQALSAATGAVVLGPQDARIRLQMQSVEADENYWMPVSVAGLELQVLSVPGHTVPHLAWLFDGQLFCGDTLFALGCGRLFDGTARQLLHSLNQLSLLDAKTLVYPAHEYTLANLRFALHVVPDDRALQAYGSALARKRQTGPTLPVRLEDECRCNPFLRCHTAAMKQAVTRLAGTPVHNELECFTLLRQLKDQFRG